MADPTPVPVVAVSDWTVINYLLTTDKVYGRTPDGATKGPLDQMIQGFANRIQALREGIDTQTSYDNMRQYAGPLNMIYNRGGSWQTGTRQVPDGTAGYFYFDRTNTTAVDNGGTQLAVTVNGTRVGTMFRIFDGPHNTKWWKTDPTENLGNGAQFNAAIMASNNTELVTEGGVYNIDWSTPIVIPRNWGLKWRALGTDTGSVVIEARYGTSPTGPAPSYTVTDSGGTQHTTTAADWFLIDCGTMLNPQDPSVDYSYSGTLIHGMEIKGWGAKGSGVNLDEIGHPDIYLNINGFYGWGLRIHKNQDGWMKVNVQGCGHSTTTKTPDTANPQSETSWEYWDDIVNDSMTDKPGIEFIGDYDPTTGARTDACNMLRFEGEVEGMNCSPSIRLDAGIGLWLFNIHAEHRNNDMLTYARPTVAQVGGTGLVSAGTFIENESAEILFTDSQISQNINLYIGTGYGYMTIDNVNGRGFQSKCTNTISVPHSLVLQGQTVCGDISIQGSDLQIYQGVHCGGVTMTYPIPGCIVNGAKLAGDFSTGYMSVTNDQIIGIDVRDCHIEGNFHGGSDNSRYSGCVITGNLQIAQSGGLCHMRFVKGTVDISGSYGLDYLPDRNQKLNGFGAPGDLKDDDAGGNNAAPLGSIFWYNAPDANGNMFAMKTALSGKVWTGNKSGTPVPVN